MSKNELATFQEGTFSYEYQPATLEIKNYEDIQETIDTIAATYKDRVYQEDDLASLTEDHAMLNGLRKGLEDGRINVKKEVMKPYDKFQKDIKQLVSTIDEVLQPIKEGRDAIYQAQLEAREEALEDYLERQLKGIEVRIGDIEIPSQWTNKGNWTDKLNPRKPLVEEIKREIERIQEENNRKLKEREVLETFLDEKGMEHAGWTRQLEYRDAFDIIKEIQEADEREKKEKERQAEYKKELERIRQADVEPEAEMERDFVEVAPEVFAEKIEVSATREQLKALYKFMDMNRINYRPVIEETLDDLPW